MHLVAFALNATRFENCVIGRRLLDRKLDLERPREHLGIVERRFVIDGIVGHPREALLHV